MPSGVAGGRAAAGVPAPAPAPAALPLCAAASSMAAAPTAVRFRPARARDTSSYWPEVRQRVRPRSTTPPPAALLGDRQRAGPGPVLPAHTPRCEERVRAPGGSLRARGDPRLPAAPRPRVGRWRLQPSPARASRAGGSRASPPSSPGFSCPSLSPQDPSCALSPRVAALSGHPLCKNASSTAVNSPCHWSGARALLENWLKPVFSSQIFPPLPSHRQPSCATELPPPPACPPHPRWGESLLKGKGTIGD